ncbi:hypothetical protein EDD21DRAFT_112414 [Dissophora ornata]|nr:hypothetical protein EDD21DRAFT_112414 [Dissophora ornata]
MMGRLNALSAILEVNPMTPDRLLSSLPEVSDWDQFNQFNQFCSTLFEDVSGEAFEPQSYDTPLFPEYEQKQTPIALDAKYGSIDGFQNYNAATGLDSGSLASYGMGVDSIYSTVIPDDPFVPPTTSTTLPYGSSDMQWDPSFTQQRPSVMSSHIAKSTVHQSSRYTNPQYVSLPALQQGPSQVKVEPDEPVLEHKVVVKVEREFADMSTQTKGNQNGMMMKQRPSASVKAHKLHEPIDAEALLELAPDVPNTPLPETDVDEAGAADNTTNPGQEQQQEASNSEESQSGEADAVTTVSTSAAPQTKAGSYMQKLRARQAAVAAAAAATAAETSEPIDPVEAMSRQLAQTRLDGPDVKYTLKPSTTKPITAGDMERQIKAAKARALCSEDPVRKQHAEVILNLLKNIDTLMTEHREKVAHYKAAQINGAAYPRTGSGVHVQNHGQIRTVSSYLPRRGAPSSTTHRPSPLRQDHGVDFKAVPDYSQLRSNLTEGSSYSSPAVLATSTSHSNGGVYNTHDEVSTDSPVLYPTSDLHHSSIIPFELSEEERRFIEEDNAKIAAAQAASAASDYHLV